MPTDRPMNLLYLHSHDTGRCMSPYGYPVDMPAYDALAASATVFRRAFSVAPTCSPSRAALLTGETPHSAGMMGLAHRGFDLLHPERHLAAFLGQHGFHTILAGHQHLTRFHPTFLGYQRVLDSADRSAQTISTNAERVLDEIIARNDETPFFLDVGFEESHRPFPSVEAGAGDHLSVFSSLPDVPAIRDDVAAFHASLRTLDQAVGRVLGALDRTGLARNTIVLLTTDHGPAFPGLKATLTDGGLGVGLILRVPGVTPENSVSDALVSHLDLYPSLCDWLGLARPDWCQGSSLAPLFPGNRQELHAEVVGEVTFHAAYEPQRSIRTDRWTFIRRFDDYSFRVLANVDASPTRDALLAAGWGDVELPRIMLFDNLLDPGQTVNLAFDEGHAEVFADLDARLFRWMVQTGDPLLSGPVGLPPGAVANKQTARLADEELFSEGHS